MKKKVEKVGYGENLEIRVEHSNPKRPLATYIVLRARIRNDNYAGGATDSQVELNQTK